MWQYAQTCLLGSLSRRSGQTEAVLSVESVLQYSKRFDRGAGFRALQSRVNHSLHAVGIPVFPAPRHCYIIFTDSTQTGNFTGRDSAAVHFARAGSIQISSL
ncbi:MAG: hypothetical protein ACOY90_05050 [Candidatus Zhuqueibacterota bacterium]